MGPRQHTKLRDTLAQVAAVLLLAVIVSAFGTGSLRAEDRARSTTAALEQPPAQPDPSRHYLFYLHGRIIENRGRRPSHPRWGVYEYDRVLGALAADGSIVISEARAARTRPARYAKKMVAQIRRLLDAGVPPAHIGVVGFSKGGWIAHLVSARLDAPVRYVMLAMCPGPKQPRRPLHGHILSIRERSDRLSTSCQEIFKASTDALDTRELVINIGGGHGAFYRPHDAWLAPLTTFLRK